jgi:hypothetical protein
MRVLLVEIYSTTSMQETSLLLSLSYSVWNFLIALTHPLCHNSLILFIDMRKLSESLLLI